MLGSAVGRVTAPSRRQLAWRIAAILAAAALGGLLFVAAPGSIQVLRSAAGDAARRGEVPRWARPCLAEGSSFDPQRQAFCARVDGRVIASESKTNGETHLLVTGGFHITLVELPDRTPVPSWGDRIVAIGPLQRAGGGLREVQAITLKQK